MNQDTNKKMKALVLVKLQRKALNRWCVKYKRSMSSIGEGMKYLITESHRTDLFPEKKRRFHKGSGVFSLSGFQRFLPLRVLFLLYFVALTGKAGVIMPQLAFDGFIIHFGIVHEGGHSTEKRHPEA